MKGAGAVLSRSERATRTKLRRFRIGRSDSEVHSTEYAGDRSGAPLEGSRGAGLDMVGVRGSKKIRFRRLRICRSGAVVFLKS